MKIAIIVALAACVALGSTAPATHAVNWTAVNNKIFELENLVRDAIGKIRDIATSDNADAGAELDKILEAGTMNALAILARAQQAVKEETLTADEAKDFMTQLKDILHDVQEAAQNTLAKLSAGAASDIRDLFYATYAVAEQKAQELYGLLSSKSGRAVNWTAVTNKIFELENLVRDAIGKIRDIATSDNADAGAELDKILEAGIMNALAILGRAQEAVKEETLTADEAKAFMTQLKDILHDVQEAAQNTLAKLSAGAASDIRDLFYATYAVAEQKAQELYSLLSAFNTLAVNWTSVGNKIFEIENLVRDSVAKIRAIANGDNAQAGAELGALLDTAAAKALAALAKAQDAVKAETLTEAEAKAALTELKDILAQVQADAQTTLAKLSPGAASDIRDLFYSTYASAEQKAQELYALLRA